MSGSEGVRFDPAEAEKVSEVCWEKRRHITETREKIELYFSHIIDLWVGDATEAYIHVMKEAIRELDKVDQSYWDMLKLFDMDRKKLESADKKAQAVVAAIEPAVWADVDTGVA